MSESSTRTSSGRWHAIATGVVGSLLVALASAAGLVLGGATSRLSATRRRPRA